MKKTTTIIIIFIILISIGLFGIINFKEKNIGKEKINTSKENITIKSKKTIKKEINRNEKLEKIKRKLALKGLINEGDSYLLNKEYTTALTKYLKIHKDIPEDEMTIKKIGDTYFYLKKFKQAYKYYSKIKNFKYLNKDLASLSLIYSNEINTGTLDYINTELSTLNLDKNQYFYYTNSLTCINNYNLCLKNFENLFIQNNIKNTNGTGSITNKNILSNDINNIKRAFDNYKNSQSKNDIAYKNALITGAFFENGMYPVSIKLGQDILKTNKDYKAILKIIAKSYYEIGDNILAKEYLLKYKKLDTNNSEISYFLGVVYEKLNEDTLSIIHFNKAIKQGYKNSLNARRRLIYLYYNTGEIDKMLQIFKDIFKYNKDELQIDDLYIAIYYHILNNKIEDAKELSEYGIQKFNKSEKFYGYLAWIELEELNNKINKLKIDEIEKNIKKAIELNKNSPMIHYIKGKLELIKKNYKKAYIYFKQTINLDYNGDFGTIAQNELDKLELIK